MLTNVMGRLSYYRICLSCWPKLWEDFLSIGFVLHVYHSNGNTYLVSNKSYIMLTNVMGRLSYYRICLSWCWPKLWEDFLSIGLALHVDQSYGKTYLVSDLSYMLTTVMGILTWYRICLMLTKVIRLWEDFLSIGFVLDVD